MPSLVQFRHYIMWYTDTMQNTHTHKIKIKQAPFGILMDLMDEELG